METRKTRKKGLVSSDYLSFLAYFLGIILLSTFMIIKFPGVSEASEFKIEEVGKSTTNSIFMVSYLRSPSGDVDISDLIVISYLNNDFTKLSDASDKIIKNSFGNGAEWKMHIDKKPAIEKCSNDGNCQLLNKEEFDFILPVKNSNGIMNISLEIYHD